MLLATATNLPSFQFIHDPLLNWRLTTRESPPRTHFTSERRQSIMEDVPDLPQSSSPYPRHRRSSVLEAVGGGTLDTATVPQEAKEVQNARALQVLARVREKLTGRDFKPDEELYVGAQVDKLLAQATSVENLCQHYIGWCSFW